MVRTLKKLFYFVNFPQLLGFFEICESGNRVCKVILRIKGNV